MSPPLSVRDPEGVRGHTQIRIILEDSIKSVGREKYSEVKTELS